MRLDDMANDMAEDATRLANALPSTLRAMRDAMEGHPKAAFYEPRTSGTAQRAECENCGARADKCACDDRHIVIFPTKTDPTGDAALTSDRASMDRRDIEKQLKAARRAIEAATRIAARYKPREATDKERTEAKAKEPGCVVCATTKGHTGQPWFEYVLRNDRCRWHVEFLRDTGRDATVAETEAHHRGDRVNRPA